MLRPLPGERAAARRLNAALLAATAGEFVRLQLGWNHIGSAQVF